MEPLILMLRGVNVSGANRLPMAAFRAMLEEQGFRGVRTYIQSGNAVMLGDPATAEARVSAGLSAMGLAVPVFVLRLDEMEAVLAANPFRADGAADGKAVHVVFLKGAPRLDAEGLAAFATQGERFHLGQGAFYLHTPAGFGTSKLAEKLPRFLKAEMTARNQRSAEAIAAMARELAPG